MAIWQPRLSLRLMSTGRGRCSQYAQSICARLHLALRTSNSVERSLRPGVLLDPYCSPSSPAASTRTCGPYQAGLSSTIYGGTSGPRGSRSGTTTVTRGAAPCPAVLNPEDDLSSEDKQLLDVLLQEPSVAAVYSLAATSVPGSGSNSTDAAVEYRSGGGHITRPKMVKRQMYRRAGFVLLRQRVLHAA